MRNRPIPKGEHFKEADDVSLLAGLLLVPGTRWNEDRTSQNADEVVRRDHTRASSHLEGARCNMRGWVSASPIWGMAGGAVCDLTSAELSCPGASTQLRRQRWRRFRQLDGPGARLRREKHKNGDG